MCHSDVSPLTGQTDRQNERQTDGMKDRQKE